MSWQASTAVLKHSQAKGSARLLILAMSNYAGPDGSGIYPSVKTLCGDTKLTERAVRYLLRDLEEMGELRREPGVGRGHTNRWTVTLPGVGGRPDREPEESPEEKGQSLPLLAGEKRGNRAPEKGQDPEEKGQPGAGKGAIAGAPNQSEKNQENNPSSDARVSAEVTGADGPDDDEVFDSVSDSVGEILGAFTDRARREPNAKDRATAAELAGKFPLEAVLRGIALSFDRAEESISSLAYCRGATESEARRLAQAHVGAARPQAGPRPAPEPAASTQANVPRGRAAPGPAAEPPQWADEDTRAMFAAASRIRLEFREENQRPPDRNELRERVVAWAVETGYDLAIVEAFYKFRPELAEALTAD